MAAVASIWYQFCN